MVDEIEEKLGFGFSYKSKYRDLSSRNTVCTTYLATLRKIMCMCV